MVGAFLKWTINTWLATTGKVVAFKKYPWLQGPMADNNVIGHQYYEKFATEAGLVVDKSHTGGLVEDFAALVPATDPLKYKLNPRITHFYEHTVQYKLEVWSQWYSPIKYFSKILIRSVSAKMDQLNIPLEPLETSHGMTNEVLHLREPGGALRYACWLRKSVLSGRVVYAGFYSGCHIDDQPYVRVVFPLPGGNVTVVLQVVVQPDGSVKLVSRGKGIGDAGYYRVARRNGDSVKVRYIPLKESIHVFEDKEGVLRTDHEFSFWNIKFLHLHYKIVMR
ncbi:MAG: hypothetical protein V4649_17170 [Bacteroidota bacterium]